MSGEQTIRRGVRNARYAAIPNHVFEDDRLSMEARWLLGYLLSKPDNWTVVIGDIVKRGKCGRDKARKMIAELVEVGYADREQTREDGKFSASVLVIYDEPMAREGERNQPASESVAFLPQTDLPATAKPAPDSPAPVKSALSNNSDLTNTDSYQEREGASAIIDQGLEEDPKSLETRFDALIIGRNGNSWPRVLNKSKHWAFQQWLKLTPDERKRAEAMRDLYLSRCPKIKSGELKGKPDAALIGIYLRDKLFDLMGALDGPKDSAGAKKGGRFSAKVLGPEFSAAYFDAVLSRPQAVRLADNIRQTVLGTYERRLKFNPVGAREYLQGKGISLDADGKAVFPDTFDRDEHRRLRMAEGYPMANRLASQAQNGGEVGLPERFQGLKEAMEFVTSESVMMSAWRAWFEQHFLPFPPLGPRGGYFPAGGPDGLDDFRAALAKTSDEGEHDAA